MRAIAIVLTLLGGLLPLIGLLLAWLRARRAFTPLDADLRRITELVSRNTPADEIAAVREPQFMNGELPYTPELVERAILRSALEDLRGPALLAAAGVVLATAGSVLSLYV